MVQARKHHRYRLELATIFSWKEGGDVWQHNVGLTRDLSAQGAFIFAASPPPSGAGLKVQALLPPGSAALSIIMSAPGQVVRVEPPQDGRPAGFAVSGRRFVLRRREEHS
ncbi:MAG: PilZ domain-containing protein [Terriglobia bacterium]|jgi:hypothetical protein